MRRPGERMELLYVRVSALGDTASVQFRLGLAAERLDRVKEME